MKLCAVEMEWNVQGYPGNLVELQESETHVSGCTEFYNVIKKYILNHYSLNNWHWLLCECCRILFNTISLGVFLDADLFFSVVGCMLYDCCKFLRNFSLAYVLHASSPLISLK